MTSIQPVADVPSRAGPMGLLVRHAGLKPVKQLWLALYAGNPGFTPYQEYHYCRVVERYFVFSTRQRHRNVVYEYRDPTGAGVILFPLHLRTSKQGTVAYLWGEFSQAGCLDFIYKADLRPETFREAFALLARALGKVKFVFSRVSGCSRLNELIRTGLAPEQYSFATESCVHIDLATSFDQYYQDLSRHVRQNLRTSVNRMKKENLEFEVRTRTDAPLGMGLLRELFRIYWQRLAEKQIRFHFTRFLPYYLRMLSNPSIVALNKLPNVFSSIIYIDKAIAGFCAGFTSRDGTIILPFLAIDSRFARFSPGGILLTETLRNLMDAGHPGYFDLSRGDEAYKSAYGGVEYLNFSYKINLNGIDCG